MLLDTFLILVMDVSVYFKHNHLIGTNVLCDGLYKLKLDGLYVETILTLIIMLALNIV